MNNQLKQILSGKWENHTIPFFWQTGEDHETLKTELEKIKESGISAVCLESRTHEQFAEEKWFEDFAFLLSEAKRLDMKVWLLDDKHFPTGYANGKIIEKYPEHRQLHIVERHIDVVGPRKGTILLNAAGEKKSVSDRNLIAAIAVKRTQREEILTDDAINITEYVSGNFLYWEVPKGCYRIFLLYSTHEGSLRNGYIDMLSQDSVDVLINEIYEPHYRRFKDEFGKTFMGFFSDEPGFANGMWGGGGVQQGFYDYKIGTPGMAYPWNKDILFKLSERLGCDATLLLPALWYPIDKKTASVRYAYMDIVTCYYRDCFSRRLGNWCREHNVSYIGHVIEDMDCHAHLGHGAGHYFRAVDGQDMAGVDVVLQQILPGMSGFTHTCVAYSSAADSQFFDYALAKLASSMAHLNPRMKGRALCEVYGAYGWAEGCPDMKWLTDHMLVRGINYFVPHAFTARYPNSDCPPHFYAAGNYNQYKYFKVLMDYCNKMSTVLSGGVHIASAAILYHAENEWCDENSMQIQLPAQVLYDEHLDFDIVPFDYLSGDVQVCDNRLIINGETFPCLVVPYSKTMPLVLIERIAEFAQKGLKVFFIDGFPTSSDKGELSDKLFEKLFESIPLTELSQRIKSLEMSDITFSEGIPYLRHFHCVCGKSHRFMFFNEDTVRAQADITLPVSGEYGYISFLNDIAEKRYTSDGKVKITLEAGESCLLIFGEDVSFLEYEKSWKSEDVINLDGQYKITGYNKENNLSSPVFSVEKELCNITQGEMYPDFSGIIKYEKEFCLPKADRYLLDFGEVGETISLYINGKYVSSRICAPYRFDITEFVNGSKCILSAQVANSMAYREKDEFSKSMMFAQSGILGPVRVLCLKQ